MLVEIPMKDARTHKSFEQAVQEFHASAILQQKMKGNRRLLIGQYLLYLNPAIYKQAIDHAFVYGDLKVKMHKNTLRVYLEGTDKAMKAYVHFLLSMRNSQQGLHTKKYVYEQSATKEKETVA